MGNRAVITTADRKIGIYLHWNGGRDTVEPLLRYCELKGYRAPSSDDYGWARLCQVIGNFFGGTLSVGTMPYSDDKHMNPGDNGIYVIEGWRIADRILPYEGFVEQGSHDFDGMLRAFDEAMPEGERLGALLDAEEIPSSELEMGGRGLGERLRRAMGALPRGCPLRRRHAARRPIRPRRRLELEPEQQDRIRHRPHRPEGVGGDAKGSRPAGGSLLRLSRSLFPIAIAPYRR